MERTSDNEPLKSERIGGRLSRAQIDVHLTALPGWEVINQDSALRREIEFPTLRAALAFLTYVIEIAEAMDHRPGVRLEDNRVTLTLTTHSVGGLTERDLILASRILT